MKEQSATSTLKIMTYDIAPLVSLAGLLGANVSIAVKPNAVMHFSIQVNCGKWNTSYELDSSSPEADFKKLVAQIAASAPTK